MQKIVYSVKVFNFRKCFENVTFEYTLIQIYAQFIFLKRSENCSYITSISLCSCKQLIPLCLAIHIASLLCTLLRIENITLAEIMLPDVGRYAYVTPVSGVFLRFELRKYM